MNARQIILEEAKEHVARWDYLVDDARIGTRIGLMRELYALATTPVEQEIPDNLLMQELDLLVKQSGPSAQRALHLLFRRMEAMQQQIAGLKIEQANGANNAQG